MKLFAASLALTAMIPSALAESPPVLPQTCAIAYDDPHLTTYDGHNYDCQGNGDFVLSKSLDSDFELQGRFYKEDWPSGLVGTTTTAAVLKTGTVGEPKVEASYDRQCNLKYYINDQLQSDLEDTLNTGNSKVSFYKSGKDRYFYFEDSGISFHLTLRLNHVFGCFLNVKLCIPDSLKSENIVGLMGSPDDNTQNDYMDQQGTDLETVGKIFWGQVHDYCTSTWCIGNTGDSLFETPGDASLCQAPYDDKCEQEVKNAPDEIKQKCGDDLACMIDAIVSGDSDTGVETKNDERDLAGTEEIEDCDESLQMKTEICALPDMADDFSVVAFEDAHIGAHSMYKGVAIGGTLYDASPNESGTIDKTTSYIKTLDMNHRFNFNKPKEFGSSCVSDSMMDRLAYLARNAVPHDDGHYIVEVKTKGGEYDLDDFRNGGQSEDNGMTLAIFNTDEDIIIKDESGRQFGPTIIAPFAKVTVKEGTGYVDGSIYAKTLYAEDGALQLHGDTYVGPIDCGNGPEGGNSPPTTDKSGDGDETPKESGGCQAAWAQCGGNGYTGATCCVEGHQCVRDSEWWSACKPLPPSGGSCRKEWEQCGGNGYSGETCCEAGTTCVVETEWWAACKPGSSNPSPPTAAPTSSPTDEPESCSLPSGLTFGSYDGNPQCHSGGANAPFGFEYGWKMNGCQEGTYYLDAVPGGGGEIKGSCSAASSITMTVTCNADKSATLSWTGEGGTLVVIKMKGGPGGELYDTAGVNGGTYFAGMNGSGRNRADISHIEVCIQCKDCGPEARSTTSSPTEMPTEKPETGAPTQMPTEKPETGAPTQMPTERPETGAPTESPTEKPETGAPTESPTEKPETGAPTESPTEKPETGAPTESPTEKPETGAPTESPTDKPETGAPTESPTDKPETGAPTESPTEKPETGAPTESPTEKPETGAPTESPTDKPETGAPTESPTEKPETGAPTESPTEKPETGAPTESPTEKPETGAPTESPTEKPETGAPTESPTEHEFEPCPEEMPGFDSPCNFAGDCEYGKETCCDGSEHVSVVMQCDGGFTQGFNTDACMSITCEPEPVVCTTDVKECADGTVVGRTGPNCEFDCPTEKTITTPPKKGSGSGDPHFKTWTGQKFDYHGECDLVLVDNPSFANGMGLRLHIRTTKVKFFSFIEKVALQIGKDVLEFDNDVENFLINGAKVEANRKHHKTMLGGFVVRRDPKALSVRLHDGTGLHKRTGAAKIDFHTRKNGFPAVIVDGGNTDMFEGSLGLLGEWSTGRTLARDGKTEIHVEQFEATDFALEWQVRHSDPMLFKEARFPQFPTTCTPPAKRSGDRLGNSHWKKEAEEACAHWKEDKEDCIFDVIATRDILVAQEGHIVHVE